MSRTTFAFHFKASAGIAPLTYLTEWRMRLAERVGGALESVADGTFRGIQEVSVAAVAQSPGRSPSAYRKNAVSSDELRPTTVSAAT
jgi:methylphosphotriester-DNA--protein-cysteine methyltransferase